MVIHDSRIVNWQQHNYYRGEDCIKDLRNHAAKIINCEKKEILPLTNEKKKSYCKQKLCYIPKKEFSDYNGDDKNTIKFGTIVIMLVNIGALHVISVI